MHLPHQGPRETDPRGPEAEEFAKRIPHRSFERQVALDGDRFVFAAAAEIEPYLTVDAPVGAIVEVGSIQLF